MGLRTKFTLLLVVLACSFMAYIHYLVIPPVGERALGIAESGHRAHLQLTAEAITPSLLESDLAKVYELLNAIRYDNPSWRQVELYSPGGARLYPLVEHIDFADDIPILILEAPVGFLKPPIANLVVSVDMSSSIGIANELETSLLLALGLLLLVLLVAIWCEVEWLIRRPLAQMVLAAHKLTKGNFHAALPLRNSDELGELACAFADMRAVMERHHIDVAAELEQQRAHAKVLQLEKMRAEFDATHDLLTGLLNRRELERQVSVALDKVQADPSKCYALLFLDLDHFKAVNDSCGHLAGDQLLCEITSVMRRRIREQDVFARMGGDEFAILLPGCDVKAGARIAHDVCRAVYQYCFEYDHRVFRVGSSIGLTVLTADSMGVEQVIVEADMACYKAKRKGRNRVEVADHLEYADIVSTGKD